MQTKSRMLLLGALIASASVLTGLFYFAKGNMVYYWRTDELADLNDEPCTSFPRACAGPLRCTS